jgi:hypothetical protein
MRYKPALKALTARISPKDFAGELGVSVSAVRQAALPDAAPSARPVPSGWRTVAARLAQEKADHFQRLAERLMRRP